MPSELCFLPSHPLPTTPSRCEYFSFVWIKRPFERTDTRHALFHCDKAVTFPAGHSWHEKGLFVPFLQEQQELLSLAAECCIHRSGKTPPAWISPLPLLQKKRNSKVCEITGWILTNQSANDKESTLSTPHLSRFHLAHILQKRAVALWAVSYLSSKEPEITFFSIGWVGGRNVYFSKGTCKRRPSPYSWLSWSWQALGRWRHSLRVPRCEGSHPSLHPAMPWAEFQTSAVASLLSTGSVIGEKHESGEEEDQKLV